eukprot:scaffold270419_cov38-Attheya_sp.AAC.1
MFKLLSLIKNDYSKNGGEETTLYISDNKGQISLHLVSKRGKVEQAEKWQHETCQYFLIESSLGSDGVYDTADANGQTPLHGVVRSNDQVDVAKAIVADGGEASINAPDNEGRRTIHVGCKKRDINIVEALI